MGSSTEILDDADRKKVEVRIWLQILSLESTIFGQLNSTMIAQYGLSIAKFEFLAQVQRYPEGITLGKISENLKVTSGNVSGLVRRLLADGLITKKMSSQDRRSFIVRFTPKGRELFDLANTLHAKTLAACFGGIPAKDLEESLKALRFLSSHIHGHSDG